MTAGIAHGNAFNCVRALNCTDYSAEIYRINYLYLADNNNDNNGRPDIVVVDKQNNRAFVVDITVLGEESKRR